MKVFWFLLFVGLGSVLAIDQCIQPLDIDDSRGFNMSNCEDAEIGIKWKKTHGLALAVEGAAVEFNLTLNGNCEVNFNRRDTKDGIWVIKYDGNESFLFYPLLQIDKDGKFRRLIYDEEVICPGHELRNRIDDEWVWTKVRVQDESQSGGIQFSVFVSMAEEGEGVEYDPLGL
ncbi:hypothetical protein M3Y94_00012900 [Aphelenchoides besseyi]|nr:hypothetical protein M3Y94_00012900 [Aphelenchoides besseyi]KAI6216831.1 hypothetical protein M3Y95_01255900 [Aphelenchoides besseyi]